MFSNINIRQNRNANKNYRKTIKLQVTIDFLFSVSIISVQNNKKSVIKSATKVPSHFDKA